MWMVNQCAVLELQTLDDMSAVCQPRGLLTSPSLAAIAGVIWPEWIVAAMAAGVTWLELLVAAVADVPATAITVISPTATAAPVRAALPRLSRSRLT